MEPAEILSKPYVRQVVPQPDGLFKAEILEFPGCFAVGETAPEALVNLEEVAVDWVAAALAHGQDIPKPTERASYSGKFVLRMAKTLHQKATQFALRDGVSLNQFIVNCVAEHVGMLARPSMHHVIPASLNANFTLHVNAGWSVSSEFPGRAGLAYAATPTSTSMVPVTIDRYQEETHA